MITFNKSHYLPNRVISKTIREMIRVYGAQKTYNEITSGKYGMICSTSPNRALRNFNAVTMHQYI